MHDMTRTIIHTTLCLLLAATHLSSQTSEHYFLIFSARGGSLQPFSLAGHAFVSWGKGQRDSATATTTLGLYPHPASSSAETVLGGQFAHLQAGFGKNSNHQPTYRVVFEVDSAGWAAAKDTASAWQGREYSLLGNNCVAFIAAVAEAAGLDTPHAHLAPGVPRRPTRYIRALTRHNAESVVPMSRIRYQNEQPDESSAPVFSLRANGRKEAE
jgi:hypothetical protein